MATDPFTKTVRLGKGHWGNVYAKISFTGSNLSIVGVEGPTRDGNCLGSCGQVNMSFEVDKVTPAPGWTQDLIATFLEFWNTWHLNDMQAGTLAQIEHLGRHKFPGYPLNHYEWACDTLRAAGLNPDNGYRYGSA